MTGSGRDAKIVLFLTLWVGNFHSKSPLWPYQCFLITQTQFKALSTQSSFLSSLLQKDQAFRPSVQPPLASTPFSQSPAHPIPPWCLLCGGPEVIKSWIPLQFPYQVVSTQLCSAPSNERLTASSAVAPNLGNSHQFAVFPILIWNLSSSRWSQFCQLK